MKKYWLLIIFFAVSVLFLSACSTGSKSPIKYERKFGKYFGEKTEAKSQGNVVDLSEGPKLRYDAKFGPGDLNFDIKIINPY